MNGDEISVRIVTATRDRHVTARVDGLSYEAADPGGGTTATFTLREAREAWPDIAGARVFVYDAVTAQILWDGWIDNPGEAYADADTSKVSARGPSILASQRTRALWYIDTGFEHFSDQYTYAPTAGTRIQGASESVGDEPSLTAVDDEDPDEEKPQAVTIQMPSGSIIGSGTYAGMRWAGADASEMLIRAFSFRTKAGFGPDTNYRMRISGWHAAVDRAVTTAEATMALVTPIPTGNLFLWLQRPSGGATTIPNDNYWASYADPLVKAELVDRRGATVVPTLDRWVSVAAVVEDLAGRMLVDVDAGLVEIDTSAGHRIDQLLYPDGTTAAAVLGDLLGWEPDHTWRVHDAETPHRRHGFGFTRRPTVARYEISRVDGVEFPGGDNDVATEAIVFWNDPAANGRRRRTLASAADASEAWIHAGGRTLTADPVTLDEDKASAANAQRAAEIVLAARERPTRSGTAAVARPVRDLLTGARVPARRIRVGELVRVRETGELLPITEITYSADERTANLTIGWPETQLDDLLADIPATS